MRHVQNNKTNDIAFFIENVLTEREFSYLQEQNWIDRAKQFGKGALAAGAMAMTGAGNANAQEPVSTAVTTNAEIQAKVSANDQLIQNFINKYPDHNIAIMLKTIIKDGTLKIKETAGQIMALWRNNSVNQQEATKHLKGLLSDIQFGKAAAAWDAKNANKPAGPNSVQGQTDAFFKKSNDYLNKANPK